MNIEHELLGYEWILLVKWLRADRPGTSRYEELSSFSKARVTETQRSRANAQRKQDE